MIDKTSAKQLSPLQQPTAESLPSNVPCVTFTIVNFGIITTLQGNNNVAIEKKYKFVNSRKAQPLPSILPE